MKTAVGILLALLQILVQVNPSLQTSVDCKTNTIGKDYAGTISITRSGKACQPWGWDHPHRHEVDPASIPEGNFGQARNYCRNPGGSSPGGPWCYTLDKNVRWEYCDIPLCTARDCKTTALGIEYRGTTSVTIYGKTCQAWGSSWPHRHSVDPTRMPEGNFADAKNYCRNPGGSSGGPWCYTTDPNTRWEYCGIPRCSTPAPVNCKTGVGRDYRGTTSVTKSNKKCQIWATQSPHSHSVDPARMPEGNFADAKNYCRNPGGSPGGPWCYTTDPTSRWEYCNIPLCQTPAPVDCITTTLGKEYRGTTSVTKTNKKCQAWASNSPHSHGVDPTRMPEGNFADAKNYCRNPGGSPGGPWCYTMDPTSRWEYCDIPLCSA